MADIIWVVVFLCVLIASCFGMYYFQGENKQKFVFCFLLVALSFGVLAFRLLDIAYTVINAAIKTAGIYCAIEDYEELVVAVLTNAR